MLQRGADLSSTSPIEVRDMAIIHQTFRRAYEEGAQLVRATPTPSPGRVTFLADHIDFGLTMLHHHHEGEDVILYPLLVQRVPDHATRTEQIDHEHQVVAGSIDAARSRAMKVVAGDAGSAYAFHLTSTKRPSSVVMPNVLFAR